MIPKGCPFSSVQSSFIIAIDWTIADQHISFAKSSLLNGRYLEAQLDVQVLVAVFVMYQFRYYQVSRSRNLDKRTSSLNPLTCPFSMYTIVSTAQYSPFRISQHTKGRREKKILYLLTYVPKGGGVLTLFLKLKSTKVGVFCFNV